MIWFPYVKVKYLAPTTTKGARLKFSWYDRKILTVVPRDYSKSVEEQIEDVLASKKLNVLGYIEHKGEYYIIYEPCN